MHFDNIVPNASTICYISVLIVSYKFLNQANIVNIKSNDYFLHWNRGAFILTHWGWVTHICVSKLTIIGSGNGLSRGRRQAIISTSVDMVLIGPLGTNFSEIFIEIDTFSSKKMQIKLSGKCRPFCLGLNVLTLSILRPSNPLTCPTGFLDLDFRNIFKSLKNARRIFVLVWTMMKTNHISSTNHSYIFHMMHSRGKRCEI